jgi:hypothetical protein
VHEEHNICVSFSAPGSLVMLVKNNVLCGVYLCVFSKRHFLTHDCNQEIPVYMYVLLGISPASDCERTYTRFRTWRKFEIKKKYLV